MIARMALLCSLLLALAACDHDPAAAGEPTAIPVTEPALESVQGLTTAAAEAPSPAPPVPAEPVRESAPPGSAAKGPRPDVFLFVVDTLRADSLEPYGAGPGRSPFVAELARRGVTFTRAWSTSSWTVPAMNSLITGLYPREHGIDRGGVGQGGVVGQRVLPDQAVTLAERLKAAGYATFGICTNQHLHPRFGFAQGFDHYVGEGFLKLPFPDLAVDSLLEQVRGAEPVFVWLLYFDPHHPWRANQPWFERWNESGFEDWNALALDAAGRIHRARNDLPEGEPIPAEQAVEVHRRSRLAGLLDPRDLIQVARRGGAGIAQRYFRFLRAAYDSEVARCDESLRRNFERLGVGDDDLVIFTADHGEEFDDHGSIGHRFRGSLYQELVHVPLIVLLPGRKHAGRTVDAPVSLVDILPTVLEVAGIHVPGGGHSGTSLLEAIEGRADPARALHGELSEPLADVRFRLEWPWKYIHDFTRDRGELYRLDTDPGEQRDLADDQPERAARMRASLLAWMERTPPNWPELESVPLSNQEIERLRAMGYLQ
jgi:arylsulfatase A-like enzyme